VQLRAAILIQKCTRRALIRLMMGLRPGDSFLDEAVLQLVQTKLAERRLADALARLSPESQKVVGKLGTQLANMAKDAVRCPPARDLEPAA
jgi:hypothetical protein